MRLSTSIILYLRSWQLVYRYCRYMSILYDCFMFWNRTSLVRELYNLCLYYIFAYKIRKLDISYSFVYDHFYLYIHSKPYIDSSILTLLHINIHWFSPYSNTHIFFLGKTQTHIYIGIILSGSMMRVSALYFPLIVSFLQWNNICLFVFLKKETTFVAQNMKQLWKIML